MIRDPNSTPFPRCAECGKVRYPTRKIARRFRRINHSNEEHMTVYSCSGAWHFGHDNRHKGTCDDLDATQTALATRLHVTPSRSTLAAMTNIARAAQERHEQSA